MAVRLQKFLADGGVASRRKAEELIFDGKVTVNGCVVRELGVKIDPLMDEVSFNGRRITCIEEKIYLMLNKPIGCVTTASDQFGRKTVLDFVKDVPVRLVPVGRLDYDTSGLLILTNDGELVYKLTHPKHNVNKVYIAEVEGKPSEREFEQFRNGLELDGYTTASAGVEIMSKSEKTCILRITIHEGHNRQVRKMCEKIGCRVFTLQRIQIGCLNLGSLQTGSYRYLERKEIQYLKSH